MSRRFMVSEVQLGILQTDDAHKEIKKLLISKIIDNQYIGQSEIEIGKESDKIRQRAIIGVQRGRPKIHK